MEGLYQIGIVWCKSGNENFDWLFDGLFFHHFYRNGSGGILYPKENESGTAGDHQQIFDLLFLV